MKVFRYIIFAIIVASCSTQEGLRLTMQDNLFSEDQPSQNTVNQFFLISGQKSSANQKQKEQIFSIMSQYIKISKEELGKKLKTYHLGGPHQNDPGLYDVYGGLNFNHSKKVSTISSNTLFLSDNVKKPQSKMIIKNGRLKIGVLHITHKQDHNNQMVISQDEVLAFLKHKTYLQRRGVQGIIVFADLRSNCEARQTSGLISINEIQKTPLKCESTDPLFNFIQRLPIDRPFLLVTSGQKFSAGSLREVPIIQVNRHSSEFHLLNLSFNKVADSFDLGSSKVSSPINICTQFFGGPECLFDQRTPLQKEALFLGKKVKVQSL